MNSVFTVLFKNIILLVLLVVSVVFVATPYITLNEIMYLFSGLAFLYVIAAILEAYYLSKVSSNTLVFYYFTDGFLFKQLLKIILLIVVAVVLLLSKGIIKYLSFICFLISFTDAVILIWRYVTKRYFIALQDNELVIAFNKIEHIPIKSIIKITERHGLTYIVTQQNKTYSLRTDTMKNVDAFKQAFYTWITEKGLEPKIFKEQ